MLNMLLSVAAVSLSLVLLVPAAVFAAECVAATALRARPRAPRLPWRPRISVLVPAHNEEGGIARTLLSIMPQMLPGDRLVVVADNCSDATAEVARRAGADVVERTDEVRRGKGFALHAGVVHLSNDRPDIVVIVDADCTLEPGALDQLAARVAETGGPVQACYLMKSPPGARLDLAVREFAFVIKNLVRPLGLSKLGLPCQLTGSGMAFPWTVLNKASLANGHLVEDMKLGLDLARLGHAPTFCAAAVVLSEFPLTRAGSFTQNSRWESGHLQMVKTAMASLARHGVAGNARLVAMVLDIMVPPLALLVLLMGAAFVFSALLFAAGLSTAALAISAANLMLVAIGVSVAWIAYGSDILPVGKLYRVPVYALRKVAFYGRIFRGESDAWIRTDRRRSE